MSDLLLPKTETRMPTVVPDQAVERALPRSLIRSSHPSQPWYQWTRQPRLRHHDPPRPPPASPPTPILAPDLSGAHDGEERRGVVEQGEPGHCEGDEGDCHTPPEDTNSESRLYTAQSFFPSLILLIVLVPACITVISFVLLDFPFMFIPLVIITILMNWTSISPVTFPLHLIEFSKKYQSTIYSHEVLSTHIWKKWETSFI